MSATIPVTPPQQIARPAELTINSYNARTKWGIVANTKLMAALLAPPSVKDPIQSESRLEHGTRTIIPQNSVKLAKRDITLEVGLTAPSLTEFYTRYKSFIEELTSGWLKIASPKFLPGVIFNCRYVSCTQFTNYNGRIAKFILKLEEPNPNNRS
jgi:hypothetical protein